jgi:phosphoglycolate phosphatase
MKTSPLVVGFDLDMTLVDSADGIAQAIVAVCELHNVTIDEQEARQTIGLPLAKVFPLWLPDLPYEQLLDEYRAHYGEFGIPKSVALPGAHDALSAVKELGGRVIVVSAKKADFVQRVLDVVKMDVDAIHGYLFAETKGQALIDEGAHVYVGDHPGDITAARVANAMSVVVPTGPTTEGELREAHPDVVLNSLEEFPAWLHAEEALAALRHR